MIISSTVRRKLAEERSLRRGTLIIFCGGKLQKSVFAVFTALEDDLQNSSPGVLEKDERTVTQFQFHNGFLL